MGRDGDIGRVLTAAERVLVQMAFERKPKICSDCGVIGQVYEKRLSDRSEADEIEEACLACGLYKRYIWFGISPCADDFCLTCGHALFRYVDVGGGTVQVCARHVRGKCAAYSKETPFPVEAQRLSAAGHG